MIGSYLIVALVCALGLSFLGIVHRFWLRDAAGEQAPSVRIQNETPVSNTGEKGVRKPLSALSQMQVARRSQSWSRENIL